MVRGNINTSTHQLPFVTRINCSYLTIKVLFAVELSIRKIVKEALITPSAFQFRTVHPSAFQSKHLRNSSLLTFQMTVSVNLRLSAPPFRAHILFRRRNTSTAILGLYSPNTFFALELFPLYSSEIKGRFLDTKYVIGKRNQSTGANKTILPIFPFTPRMKTAKKYLFLFLLI